MTATINGCVYDTGKATMDKKFTYGAPGDEYGYEETLYITAEGRYFIYTNGGRLSVHPHETITPIAREQVKDWLLSH